MCSMTFDASLSHFVYLCTFVSCLNSRGRNLVFSATGWDDLDTRKHKSGILGELLLRSSNMIHSLKATVPPFSSEDGEETTYCAYLPVRQCLTAFLLFLLHPRTQAYKYTMETVRIPHRCKHQCTHSLCQSVSEVKLFHLSGVLLSSYKASVRTAGRLIVTY